MRKYKAAITSSNQSVQKLLTSIGFEVIQQHEIKRNRPDVMVFPGGADISPSLYCQEEELYTNAYCPERDLREANLINTCKIFKIPMLGICRGHQLIHSQFGGTLIQHVAGHSGPNHKLSDTIPGWGKLEVNSTHHQAVPMSNTDIYETAYGADSPEGQLAEIIIDKSLGVFTFQFHPEYSNCSEKAKEFFTEVVNKDLKGLL